MRRLAHSTRCKVDAGIALLISIFVLLLVCVAGIAMVVASGTESALTGNYQSSTAVYYAAAAGLEEGRGRLLVQDPNYINNAVPGFIPTGTMPIGKIVYIVNGGGVNPLDSANPASFPDLEYDREFVSGPSLATANANGTVSTTASVSAVAGLPGPLYKWVRINAVTEQAINLDVDSNGTMDSTTPLYYDGAHLTTAAVGSQAFEVTALAAYPNGTQKILQYLTAAPPAALNLNLPAALVLSGNNVQFFGPTYNSFVVSGQDSISVNGCSPSPGVSGIGYTNNGDSSYTNIIAPATNVMANKANYNGVDAMLPDVTFVGSTLSPNLQTISGLNSLVQTITQNAGVVVTDPPSHNLATIAPPGMSASNPGIIVVNGDLTLDDTSNFTGYGILLVTGTLTYDPHTTWNGLVLVIGKGVMNTVGFYPGKINGGVLIAKTTDDLGNPLSSLGASKFFFQAPNTDASLGVRYSSCWINAVQLRLVYKVLSFREIPQ